MTSNKDHSYQLYALHGFLGCSSDWRMFDFITLPVAIEREELDCWSWSRVFNGTVHKNRGKNILLGYSLGGRLAMHALISNPELWDAAILISAHPGLSNRPEREMRLEIDQKWAQRFLVDPWERLMSDWNSNAVFAGHPLPFSRIEHQFNRNKLAQQLINWSLGNQEPLLNHLKELSIPMMFLAGERDSKFCELAEQFRAFSKVSMIANAAHRLPWDQPKAFTATVKQFIKDII